MAMRLRSQLFVVNLVNILHSKLVRRMNVNIRIVIFWIVLRLIHISERSCLLIDILRANIWSWIDAHLLRIYVCVRDSACSKLSRLEEFLPVLWPSELLLWIRRLFNLFVLGKIHLRHMDMLKTCLIRSCLSSRSPFRFVIPSCIRWAHLILVLIGILIRLKAWLVLMVLWTLCVTWRNLLG